MSRRNIKGLCSVHIFVTTMAHNYQPNFQPDVELWQQRAPRAGFWLGVLPNHPEIDAIHRDGQFGNPPAVHHVNPALPPQGCNIPPGYPRNQPPPQVPVQVPSAAARPQAVMPRSGS